MKNDWPAELVTRIEQRRALVAIVGLGYVGLPLALRCVETGFSVLGVDVDEERLEALASGRSYLVDVPSDELAGALDSGAFRGTSNYDEVRDADVIVITVPTPLAGEMPDLRFVLAAADGLATRIKRGALVSLESTTYPGTTEEIVRPRLEAGGLRAGEDFALVFSPERIDPGNTEFGVGDIPKIVGGLTRSCAAAGEAFYSAVTSSVEVVPRPREAEMAKILENTYRQVNIALANEFAMVAHELDVDIWAVIQAAATKPFGFQPFYPGVGIGGHCISVDPVYLTWRIRELGRPPFRMVELAREIDVSMPTYIARRVQEVLAERGTSIRDARVLGLGVTYKPDVEDVRESRAISVLEELQRAGARVSFNDPYVERVNVGGSELECEDLILGVTEADIVIVLTHHSSYDWVDIAKQSKLLFDARGVTRGIDSDDVIRL